MKKNGTEAYSTNWSLPFVLLNTTKQKSFFKQAFMKT